MRHRRAFGALLDRPARDDGGHRGPALEAEAAVWTGDAPRRRLRRRRRGVGRLPPARHGGREVLDLQARPGHAYEALECLGGNGYTEAFPLARRYREQPVMAIWEGSGNVLALDVLRAIAREPATLEAFDRELQLARGVDPVYDRHVGRTRALVEQARKDPERRPPSRGDSSRRSRSRCRHRSCSARRRRPSPTPSWPRAWGRSGARSTAPCRPASTSPRWPPAPDAWEEHVSRTFSLQQDKTGDFVLLS